MESLGGNRYHDVLTSDCQKHLGLAFFMMQDSSSSQLTFIILILYSHGRLVYKRLLLTLSAAAG